MKDVIVVVRADTAPKEVDGLDVLLILTDKEREAKEYTSLESVEAELGKDSAAYKKVSALFGQGKARPAPEKLIRNVLIVGLGEKSGTELVGAIEEFQKKNNDWYMFLTDRSDDESIKALAKFAKESEPTEADLEAGKEDHRKFYVAQTNNKELTGLDGRTAVIYTQDLEEHADAAWMGAAGAWYPTYVTWKFKMPAGITAPELNVDEVNALEKNHINYVTNEYKRNYVKEGVCADGEYIDSVLGADWIAKDMRERIYDVFCENPIVPYTDAGFTLIGAAVIKSLSEAVRYGIVATDNAEGNGAYSVSIPRWEDATEDEKRTRKMPPITWEAQLSGAVHSAKVRGQLVVEL